MTTITSGSDYLDSLINSTSSSSASSSSTTTTGSSTLGESDFLKLLTTQMQTQDPFNPVDNTQMVAQMAQFSSVAGISEINSSLKSLASDLTSRLTDGASWIGKAALTDTTTATALSDGSYQGQVTLPSDATSATLSLVDASGNVVHSESLGATSAGSFAWSWDGKDADGNTAATGALTVKVTASGSSGSITPAIASWNQVTGIQSPSSGTDTKLITAAGLVSPSDVLSLA